MKRKNNFREIYKQNIKFEDYFEGEQ